MADEVKTIEQLKKQVAQLEKEVKILRDTEGKSSVADLESMVANKEKLLQIEMEISKAFGDTKAQMEQAAKLLKLMGDTSPDAYSPEKVKEYADAIGVSTEEMLRLVNQQKELGETGMEAYDMMRSGSEDVASKMGLVSKRADSIVGGILKVGKLAQDPKGLKGMALALKATFNPLRIASSLLLKVVESTFAAVMAADNATAAFAKQTGMGRIHTAGIMRLGTEHRNLGISVEDSGKAFVAATAQIGGFNSMSEASQQKLTLLAAGFDKIGVGAEVGLEMVEEFRKGLGVTADEASDMTRDLALTAKGLGVSMGKFVKGFKAANKVLAVYGKTAPKIFGNVAAAARAAGVETEALLGLAGKFDTFSDAAETTGKLNAILGTQMSAMDLLTMKEDERIEHLIKSMQASGKQFSQMDRFTQKAVAQAAGISDMAQANKIFGMSFRDYKKHQRDMAAQEKSQEEMNKRMKDAMTIVEELKAIMAEFVIKGIGPHVDTIKDFVAAFGKLVHNLMSGNAPMLATILALSGIGLVLSPLIGLLKFFGLGMGGVGKMIGRFVGFLGAKAAALFGVTVAQDNANRSQRMGSRMSIVQAKSMQLLGKAVMFIGIGIGIAAAGIALFVREFGKLSIGKMAMTAVVIGLMGVGFFFLAKGLLAATVPAAGFAVAVTAIGVAIGIVFASMSLFIGQLASVIEQLVLLSANGMGAVGVLFGIAAATLALAFAVKFLANPMAMIGMYLLLQVMQEMTAQAEAQARMAEAASAGVTAMGDLASNMGEQTEAISALAFADFFSVFTGLYFGIRSFMSALDLDSEQGVQVSHTLENLALIATGKSARTIDGGLGGAIINAINRLGQSRQKQTIRVEVDKDAIEKMMRDGYFELESE